MLEKYFSAPKTLDRLRGGLSGPYIDGFTDAGASLMAKITRVETFRYTMRLRS